MKKIIKGKMYDTETAREIGAWSNSENWKDFSYIEETLYQKRTGEFFLFGKGGASTKYAVCTGQNMWSSSSEIIPLSWETARQWTEEHLSADEYENLFGSVTESDGKTTINLSLPVSLVEQLRRDSSKVGLGISAYVEFLLNKQLNKQENN